MKLLHEMHSFNLWMTDQFVDSSKLVKTVPTATKIKSDKTGGNTSDHDKSPKAGQKRNFSNTLNTNDLDFEETEYWK
jgi:hypothetical protein